MVGNPPWEVIQPDIREFYSQFDPEIESKLTGKQVEARVAELNSQNPELAERYQLQTIRIKRLADWFKTSGHYQYQGKGKSNTHNLFLERGHQVLQEHGRLAYVIPAGIYSDSGTVDLRQMLIDNGSIDYLFNFSNERYFFPSVHHAFKFTLLGVRKKLKSDGFWASFRFNPRIAISPDSLQAFLTQSSNLIYIRLSALHMFGARDFSLMEFQTPEDYRIAEFIYSNCVAVGELLQNGWGLELTQEFNMTMDRHLFNQQNRGYPLYEGKMIHQFDPEFASPRYWIEASTGIGKLVGFESRRLDE